MIALQEDKRHRGDHRQDHDADEGTRIGLDLEKTIGTTQRLETNCARYGGLPGKMIAVAGKPSSQGQEQRQYQDQAQGCSSGGTRRNRPDDQRGQNCGNPDLEIGGQPRNRYQDHCCPDPEIESL